MRWEALFADLEAQLESRLAEDLREEIAESTRVERARQKFAETLSASRGHEVTLRLVGPTEVTGRLGPVSLDYLCLDESSSRWLIRRAALQTLTSSIPRRVSVPKLARTRFGAVVRALMRDRQAVQIYGLDGSVLGEGTLAQAAEDFLTLATHPRDEFARERSVQSHVVIPYDAVAWICAHALE